MKKKQFFSLIAAVLILCLVGGCAQPQQQQEQEQPPAVQAKATPLAEGIYPMAIRYPDAAEYENDWEEWKDAYDAWRAERKKSQALAKEAGDQDAFILKTMEEFLGGEENRIYSPLNVYMALAMVAETVDGNSRAQILDLLGVSNIRQLREEATALWQSHYRDDELVTSVLASSLWLNEKVSLKEERLKAVAEHYYASSYAGAVGTKEFDQALRDWINAQTGGLLQEQVSEISLPPEAVLTLATTIYYRAKWEGAFQASETKEQIFRGKSGDVTCDFLNKKSRNVYYWGKQFGAVRLSLEESGGMWLILPDEGVEVSALLKDEQVQQLLLGAPYTDCKELIVDLSMPKFDVSSEIDLTDGLKNLGVTDIFDMGKSDFTPLCDEALVIGRAVHDARVAVDEEGCTATAVTVMQEAGSSMPPKDEVEFTLDRPFLFAITSEHNTPLFLGTVMNP